VAQVSNHDRRTTDFVRLLTRHERRVYAYILSLVPNWADADEILQETNVRLWQQFEKYEPGTDFGSWACTIARYQVLTFRKRTGRERVHFSQAFMEAVTREMEASAPEADSRRAALSDCIGKLTETSRRLVRLVYGGGSAVNKAAEQLGRPVPATYKALSRARQFLHDCIEQQLKGGGAA
jgi:RNA polymerase sigma-70 factor, ECF subfamily